MLKTKQTENQIPSSTGWKPPVACFRFICYCSQKVEYFSVIMEVRIELRAYRAVMYPLLS